jgi:hypothetical protein
LAFAGEAIGVVRVEWCRKVLGEDEIVLDVDAVTFTPG